MINLINEIIIITRYNIYNIYNLIIFKIIVL